MYQLRLWLLLLGLPTGMCSCGFAVPRYNHMARPACLPGMHMQKHALFLSRLVPARG